jgi:hypothetical protein
VHDVLLHASAIALTSSSYSADTWISSHFVLVILQSSLQFYKLPAAACAAVSALWL